MEATTGFKLYKLLVIGHHGIFGPFFFESNMQMQILLENNRIKNYINNLVNLRILRVSCDVRSLMKAHFPERWMERCGVNDKSVPFPSHLPDCTPMEFFLWVLTEKLVFKNRK